MLLFLQMQHMLSSLSICRCSEGRYKGTASGREQTVFCLCRYENCEMRTVIISDTSVESGGLDPLFFPGGHSIKQPGKETVQSHKGPAT